MLDVKFKVNKAIKKLERMPQRHSILSESYDFVETPFGMEQHLVYDAWNPRTGFHYAELRYLHTTSGVPRWATIGGEKATPLIEKDIRKAIRKGVGN